MLRRFGYNEERHCAVTAAVEHTSCHISTQRCHCQSKSKVEHDAFPPGDKVLIPGRVTFYVVQKQGYTKMHLISYTLKK